MSRTRTWLGLMLAMHAGNQVHLVLARGQISGNLDELAAASNMMMVGSEDTVMDG